MIQPSPDGTQPRPITVTHYDRLGRVTAIIDPLGRVANFQYDILSRQTKVIAPDPDGAGPLTSPVTVYHYDNLGRTDWVQDPRGNKTYFTYDINSRVVQTKNALNDITYTTYDLTGRVVSQTDELGRVTQFVYEVLPGTSAKNARSITCGGFGAFSRRTSRNGSTMRRKSPLI